MNPLWVMMWKHKREKMRRPVRTIWETLSGVSIFVILLILSNILNNPTKTYKKLRESWVDIVFTPNNTITRKLMSEICKEKPKENVNTSPIIRCYGASNLSDVNNLRRMSNNAFQNIVVFIDFDLSENLNDREMPETLKYNIRIREPDRKAKQFWMLADLYALYDDDEYQDQFTTKNVTLLTNLQWQLDKAYLEQLSGEKIDHVVTLHDTPIHELVSAQVNLVNNFLKMCLAFAPLPIFLYTSSNMVSRNRTGMKELMKLYGVSSFTIRCSHILETTFFGIVYAFLVTVLLKVSRYPVLPFSNPLIIAITLVFHFVSTISLAFITSLLAQNYQHCDSLALLIYMMTYILNSLLYQRKLGGKFLLYIIIPHAPVFVFWDEIYTLEQRGIGTQFSNMWTSQGKRQIASVFMVWIFLLMHVLFIMCVSWYLEAVRPGMYGIAVPWNFMCRRKYWNDLKKRIGKKKVKGVNFHVTAEGDNQQRDNRYFQVPPEGTPIAIKIAGVTKIFRNFNEPDCYAIENIDLACYKGEITVLLGVNGAGKSTLLSIVTGMFGATRGKVYINGFDNSKRFRDLRKDLGYCPQREMIFDYLTVMENIYFFQQLRGDTNRFSENKDHLIRSLDLVTVGDFYSKELPTGMRRALQIVCALVGNADVLVLDEPTAGMDSRMRHRVWDLLLALRKSKTMLVSTTAMREADAIGDKIAMINHGSLKCHGSPTFLKNAIGADFKLTLRVKDGETGRNEIQQIIKDNIPDVQVAVYTDKDNPTESRMSLTLPSNDREQFPKVFDILEVKMRELGITMMDVGISIEQVFLSFLEQDDDLYHFQTDSHYAFAERLEGFKLRMFQLVVLMGRVFTFVWFHKYQFVLLQVLTPISSFMLVTISSNTYGSYSTQKTAQLTLDEPTNSTVLYHPIGCRRRDVLSPLVTHYPHVKFVASQNLEEDFQKLAQKSIIGYKISGRYTDIFYTSDPQNKQNLASAAVNIFSNIYMSLHMPYATNNHHITMSAAPLSNFSKQGYKNLYLCLGWVMWIVFLSVVPIAPLILLCIEEYYKGVRFTHLHMSVPPYIIWLGKLIPHMCIYTAIVPTSVIFAAGVLDVDNTFNNAEFLFWTFTFLMAFAPAFLIQWYVISFTMNDQQVITKIYISALCFGLIVPLLLITLIITAKEDPFLIMIMGSLILLVHLSPVCVLAYGMYHLVIVARNNAFCKAKFHLCPNFPDDDLVSGETCCGSKNGTPYVYTDSYMLFNLITLPILCIFYWIVLMLLQRRIIQNAWANLSNYMYKAPEKRCTNARVKAEEAFVKEKFNEFDLQPLETRQASSTVILADDLHRAFRLGYGKPIHAVQGISLSVQKGQCLGILGRNGAGKSTTLGMLSGFLVMTRGRCCINGFYLKKERQKYLQTVSWAAANGMDEFLSGYNNLKLLASLHGHSHRAASKLAMSNLNYLGLTSHAHQLFSSYSSGCSHRLAIAKTLISEASAVLLDEPCGSVDPHTRPLIVTAIRRLRNEGVACLITEESMDWKQIEYICDRLAIIDKGEVVATGTVEQIRRELTSGYTATLKLKIDEAYRIVTDSFHMFTTMGTKGLVPSEKVSNLKKEFIELFDTSILIDEHISMLYFHIGDPNRELLYSEMFRKLETLRQKYDVVEDYTLSETTVDEVLRRIYHILHKKDTKHHVSRKILALDTRAPSLAH